MLNSFENSFALKFDYKGAFTIGRIITIVSKVREQKKHVFVWN